MVKVLKTYLLGSLLAGISLMPLLVAAWYCASQAIIYHQMETQLQGEHLETITLKTADITWIKKGKEILFGNQLFDVKKIATRGNETTVTGLYDHQEKILKEKFGKLQGADMQGEKHLKITRPLVLFGPASGFHFNGLIVGSRTNANYLFYNELFIQHDYSLLTAPPPRFA